MIPLMPHEDTLRRCTLAVPPFSWAQEIGAMPTQPICRCMSRPSLLLCRREEAMSPGPCSNLVHPCLTVYHMHQTKSLFLQHKTIAIVFLHVFVPSVTQIAVFAAHDYREFLHVFDTFCRTKLSRNFEFVFLSSKRGLSPQMP